jgi:hypothetical protein
VRKISEISKTTIMVPDIESGKPCRNPLVPRVHYDAKELRQFVIDNIKDIDGFTKSQDVIEFGTRCISEEDKVDDAIVKVLTEMFEIKPEEIVK